MFMNDMANLRVTFYILGRFANEFIRNPTEAFLSYRSATK